MFRTLSAALVAVVVAASPAAAAPLTEDTQVQVRHGDLDLTKTHDVARLNRRIVHAAKDACGSFDPRNFPAAASAKACLTNAVASASPKVEMAVAQARSGNALAGALAANTISVP